ILRSLAPTDLSIQRRVRTRATSPKMEPPDAVEVRIAPKSNFCEEPLFENKNGGDNTETTETFQIAQTPFFLLMGRLLRSFPCRCSVSDCCKSSSRAVISPTSPIVFSLLYDHGAFFADVKT